jgi:uncharacterized damage-inducible protein DinB
MNLIDPIAEELRHEAGVTRRFLERIPEADFDWKPHEKSMSLGFLASHLAEIPKWTVEILEKDEINIDPATYTPWLAKTKEELLKAFDENLANALAVMKGQADEHLMKIWTMKMAGKPALSMPRIVVLRPFILSHTVHHRAQLGVYLRLRGVPDPAVYGPSADEESPGH